MAVVVCFLFYVSSYKNIFRRTLDTRASFLFLKAAKSFLKGNLSTLKKKEITFQMCFTKELPTFATWWLQAYPMGKKGSPSKPLLLSFSNRAAYKLQELWNISQKH